MLPTLVLFRLDAVLEPTKAADPNLLCELQRTITDAGAIHPSEQAAAVDALLSGDSVRQQRVYANLGPAVERFTALDDDAQDSFRHAVKSYVRVYPFLAQVSPVLARKHNARRRRRFLLARFADRAACLLGDRAEDAPCRWSDVPRNSSAKNVATRQGPSGRGQAGSRTRSTTSGRWSEALVGTTAAFCAVNPAETKT